MKGIYTNMTYIISQPAHPFDTLVFLPIIIIIIIIFSDYGDALNRFPSLVDSIVADVE